MTSFTFLASPFLASAFLAPRRARWGVLAAATLAAGLAVASPARADDESFELGIIKGMLGISGGDGSPSIDYRERSPLVIPPSADMPSPETGDRGQTAAWPQDPDLKRQKAANAGARKPAVDTVDAGGRALRPDELRRGTVAARQRERDVTLSDSQLSRPLTPPELGVNTSLFGMLTSNKADKPEPFTAEPARGRLTQPPPGYRTPSTAQPYQPPKDTSSWFQIPNLFDRGLSKDK